MSHARPSDGRLRLSYCWNFTRMLPLRLKLPPKVVVAAAAWAAATRSISRNDHGERLPLGNAVMVDEPIVTALVVVTVNQRMPSSLMATPSPFA